MKSEFDAVVIGSGPNGLAAAITLARTRRKVIVFEAASDVGGGLRTAELTLPGFRHDVCSSVYPLIPVAPFFRELAAKGVQPELIKPEVALTHVSSFNQAVSIYEDINRTATGLNQDSSRYVQLIQPFLKNPHRLFESILAPPLKPRNPVPLLRFGWRGFRSARSLANKWFRNEESKAMFAGMAAHSMLPLNSWLTGAVGMMFCIAAHTTGWPIARGGASSIAILLADYFRSLGGKIETCCLVSSLNELPTSRVVLFDTSPAQMLKIAGAELPSNYQKSLSKFRHGPGVCKVDWALDGPIPWKHDACRRSGTVHLGGSLDSIAAGERAVWNKQMPTEPFLLITQPSVFDAQRAPPGKHVAWSYCHVPNGYQSNVSSSIENQIESVAPGFRDLILKRHVVTASELEVYNPNYVGGDISGGAMNLWQFIARPALRIDPYSTPNPKIFICSASTPPGPGVHGMCGYYAAKSAMKRLQQ